MIDLPSIDFSLLKGKKVLVRVDFNVPIKDKGVSSDFRIKRILPTLTKLSDAGAKVVILAHIDEKEGGTLEPVARYLLNFFPTIQFIPDIYAHNAKGVVEGIKDGGLVLFENLRKFPGEKSNDLEFAKHLSSFGDVYINEAFSVSHRTHASIVGITEFLPSFAGIEFINEVNKLHEALDPHKPFLVILGGAKFETKVPLVQKFLDRADLVCVGGAIANDFFKAQGYFIGDSLVGSEPVTGIKPLLHSTKLLLPIDVRVQYKGDEFVKNPKDVGVGEKIYDIGNKSVKMIKTAIAESNFVLWNGPLGNTDAGFNVATEEVAKILADSKVPAIVGGGDVVSVIEKLNLLDKFEFVSSGGGAMLDFLTDETLVGIEALKNAKIVMPSLVVTPEKNLWDKVKELF